MPADIVPVYASGGTLVGTVAVIAEAELAVDQVLSATSYVVVDAGVPASGDDRLGSASQTVGTDASVVAAVLSVDFGARVFPPRPVGGAVLVGMIAYA